MEVLVGLTDAQRSRGWFLTSGDYKKFLYFRNMEKLRVNITHMRDVDNIIALPNTGIHAGAEGLVDITLPPNTSLYTAILADVRAKAQVSDRDALGPFYGDMAFVLSSVSR